MMKNNLIILFILMSIVIYSKFEKQFDLKQYENDIDIKSYQTTNSDLSISIANLIEFKKNRELIKLSNNEIFESFIENFENAQILESSNNVVLFKLNDKKFNGYYAMIILSKNNLLALEGKINKFNRGLQYLRLNKKISELEEKKYNLLLLKEKLN